MKFQIKHETKGRMRVHLMQKRMSYEQADMLLLNDIFFLFSFP